MARVVLRSVLRLVVNRHSAHRHNPDVLRHVLFADKVTHVVFIANGIFLIRLLLLLDLRQGLLGKASDLTQHLYHAAILCVDAHAVELVLHLRADSLQPAAYLVVDELHVFPAVVERLKLCCQVLLLVREMRILSLLCFCFIFHGHEVLNLCFVVLFGMLIVLVGPLDLATVFICNLQLSHLLQLLLVLGLELVVLLLICTNGKDELGVGLLLRHELSDDLAHVRVVRLAANLLEALLNVLVVGHLSAHAFLEEGRPEAIDNQLVSHLDLFDVLGLILGQLGDFGLTLGTSQTFLQRVLLVLNRLLQGSDTLLPLLLLVIDHLHQIVQLVLALKLLLAEVVLLHVLLAVNVGLGAQRLCELVDLEREGDQVFFLAVEHVVADFLSARLVKVLFAQDVQAQQGVLFLELAATCVL